MTLTRDRNGNALERFDVCRNIHQEGDIQFYYYIGTDNMAEFRGKVMAIFANVKHGSCPSVFERRDGKVMAMEKIPELSGITAEAQKRIKKEIARLEDRQHEKTTVL